MGCVDTDRKAVRAVTVAFALVADSAQFGPDKKLNIQGVFNNLSAPSFPATHPSLALILRFDIPIHEFNQTKLLKIALVGPDGTEIVTADGNVRVDSAPGAQKEPFTIHDQVVNFQNLLFPHSGLYAFHVMVGGETKVSAAINVQKLEVQS